MINSLYVMMLASFVVVVVCMVLIFLKFVRYFDNRRNLKSCQQNDKRDIEILKMKLSEIKLRNKGDSLDENIKNIYNDESVRFSMEWGDVLE